MPCSQQLLHVARIVRRASIFQMTSIAAHMQTTHAPFAAGGVEILSPDMSLTAKGVPNRGEGTYLTEQAQEQHRDTVRM